MILTSIKSAIGLEKIAAEKTIRIKIFVKEQGFQNEFDEIDPNAFHIVLFDKDKPIGTGRCYVDNSDQKCFHIGRITVLKEYRKYHLGNIIMKELENHIKEVGGNTIQLSSQVRAKKFYSKLGYQEEGEVYLDEFHILFIFQT